MITVIVGLVAGSYPALYLSNFQPPRVLRGVSTGGGRHRVIRGLVVGQFALSIVLIVGVLLTTQQLQLLQSKELGFDEEQVIRINVVKYREGSRVLDRLRTRLNDQPRIASLSGSWEVLGTGERVQFESPRRVNTEGQKIQAYTFGVAAGIMETLDLQLVEGRAFTVDDPPGEPSGVLVNEAQSSGRYRDLTIIIGPPVATMLGVRSMAGAKMLYAFPRNDPKVIPSNTSIGRAMQRYSWYLILALRDCVGASARAGASINLNRRIWHRSFILHVGVAYHVQAALGSSASMRGAFDPRCRAVKDGRQ